MIATIERTTTDQTIAMITPGLQMIRKSSKTAASKMQAIEEIVNCIMFPVTIGIRAE